MPEDRTENLCRYDGLISRCDALGWAQQKKCKYALKSNHRNECLYFCTDAHCWQIDANFEAREGAVKP